jgi:hypothetical protein
VMSKPKHIHALSGFGLQVVEYVTPGPAEDADGEHG